MPNLLELKIERPKVVYRQIGEQIRRLIMSGELPAGTKLPSSSELAAKWQTQPATIHAALAPLVREGLLTRVPKTGTFVCKRSARLTDVAVYYDANIWRNQASAFERAVHVDLARLLESHRINVHVWFDPRSEKQRGKVWAKLATAVERREIQAIIASEVPDDVVAWIRALPTLTAFFTNAPIPNRVHLDFDQFAEASVAELKKQGCRSAGVISTLEPGKPASARAATANGDFYQRFAECCVEQGIELRSDWVRRAKAFVRDESQEEFGYSEFKAIWNQSARPEGLVVFPDTSVPGVIISVLEQRVNVPSELKLIVHKHAEINFLCPFPISTLTSSTAQIAESLFAQVTRQFEGEVCEPIVLPFLHAPG